MSAPTTNDVVTALANLARGVPFAEEPSSYPRVRPLNDTPVTLVQGDCPQLFFLPTNDSAPYPLSFSSIEDEPSKGRHDYEVLAYYVDVAENLDTVWASRQRTAIWVGNLVEAVRQNNTLQGIVDLAQARASVRDGLTYNGVKFRGAEIRVTAFKFV